MQPVGNSHLVTGYEDVMKLNTRENAKLLFIDGMLKIGTVIFVVPTLMCLFLDIFSCVSTSSEPVGSNICRFGYMEALYEDLLTYISISFVSGLFIGMIFLMRASRSRGNELP